MFKNIISPIQAWLLSQGKCVGCGKRLNRKQKAGTVRITCNCGRIYSYDAGTNHYRRVRLDEIT